MNPLLLAEERGELLSNSDESDLEDLITPSEEEIHSL